MLMLIEGSKLNEFPILSLHTASEIARVKSPVIDPNYLKILAFEVTLLESRNRYFLDVSSIREFSKMGMIIDSDEELFERGDLIKLDKIIELGFCLDRMKVVSKKHNLLGHVADYTVVTDNFQIMQLIVKRPIYKALIDPELIIGRSEIAEINDLEIIVKGDEGSVMKKSGSLDFVPNFVNPFKDGKYIPRTSDSSSNSKQV